ncbi:Ubiquitin-like protein ATG12 [Paramyrothecium foliicola]|nr:Ubiquitin-like protein ATG12 [Paramyrothecium foliicola]
MDEDGTPPAISQDGAQAPSPAASPIPEDEADSPELPLTMTASAVLADLPRDATAALANAGAFTQEKIVVRFKPVGSAPSLAQDVCKISSGRKFEEVVRYLRRKLRCKDTDSVFLYVNSAFAPSLDEVVGNLHQVRLISQEAWAFKHSPLLTRLARL